VLVWGLDAAGNEAATPTQLVFFADRTPPVLKLAFPGASPWQGGVVIGWVATVAMSLSANELHTNSQVFVDEQLVWSGAVPAAINVTVPMQDGLHRIRMQGADLSGNQATASTAQVLRDLLPPSTTLVLHGSTLTNSTTAMLTLGGMDQIHIAKWSIRHTVQGSTTVTTAVCPPGLQGTTHELSMLSDGVHTVVAQAVDALGNVDPVGVTVVWTVDTTPPQATFIKYPSVRWVAAVC